MQQKKDNTKASSEQLQLDFTKSGIFSTSGGRGRARKTYHDKDKPVSPIVRYSLDDVNRWLQNPVSNEENLRKLSNFLYDTHPTYKLIVRYMALLVKYNWSFNLDVSKGTTKKNQDDFLKVARYLNLIVNEFEMQKASLVAYKNDIFYGYEIETKDSYFILHLNPSLCKVSSIEDGVYNFKFDFKHFDSNSHELELYPQEFTEKYKLYKNKKGTDNWIELDADKTVCMKTNPETRYTLPPFAGMFTSIYEVEEYKRMKKDRAKNDNYMLLQQTIPMKGEQPNDFLMSAEQVAFFHNGVGEGLPDGIEVVTSPMEIKAIKTEKSRNDNDLVMEAMREVYNDGGISQFLFNSDKNTSIGLSKSINTDEEIAFFWLRQNEARINRKLKYKFPSLKIKFSFLDMTIFNKDEVFDKYLKAAQNGLPVKFELAASIGLSPIDTINKLTIENDLFGLGDLFVPLKTSHTLTSDDNKGGRPTKSDDEISDSGQSNRDNDRDTRKVEG